MAASPLTSSFGSSDPKGTQKYYDEWAAKYDADVATHDYNGPRYLLELCQKYIKKTELILAVGAGTGLEGVLLRQNGYRRMHGHDGSEEMLNKARERGIFEEYFFELLEPNRKSCFRSSYYDAMVCVGCFVPGGLDERHVEDLIRTVKPGGRMVIGTREMFITDPGESFNYPYKLEEKLKSLEKAGKIKLLERKRYERYSEGGPGVFFVHQVL